MKQIRNIGLAAIVAGVLTYSACNRHEIDSVSRFNDDVVLVACTDNKLYDGVLETLHYWDDKRSKEFKMSFTKRDKYMKVSVPNMESDGSTKITYMHIVSEPNLKEVLEDMEKKLIFYDMVQLRGHTKDMRRMFKMTKEYTNPNVIYHLGGCNSHKIAKRIEKKNIATIGGKDSQNLAHNTPYLLNLINAIGTVNSWPELKQKLSESDGSFNHYVSGNN
ncbi:MAG: hypothetical protein ACP5NW_00830 [Candidatus Woesearchaeota archaeon]